LCGVTVLEMLLLLALRLVGQRSPNGPLSGRADLRITSRQRVINPTTAASTCGRMGRCISLRVPLRSTGRYLRLLGITST